ncbi:dipeptide ABC transporter ATP-binding protein [Aminobacter sp. LjRoot7]|uniref:dipeptide ABC transporter ATP-binding protein n=1 Tax=Aminobacter sp. LjRoot7 TaxID=3342335 RepID=UPI003ECD48BA
MTELKLANKAAPADAAAPVLEVDKLVVSYGHGTRREAVVHGISFSMQPGEVVALVGESGSGKSTTAHAVIGLLPENGRVEAGDIRLNGTSISGWADKRLDTIRGKVVSLISQDPVSSLNPVKTIGDQVGEILKVHNWGDRRAIEERVIELLDRVGLPQPELRARQYPHQLSGGMRQRVLIAIAVALRPTLIIADEPTSALDVTVQRRVLDLIDELRAESGTSVLLVTHDLGVAADRADRIVVLQGGQIQEVGTVADVLAAPKSAYTRQLLNDAPAFATPKTARNQPRVNAEPAIVVEGLVQHFPLSGGRQLCAVDGVSFDVARGTTHALVGESGSGKTTTVRAIAGFQKLESGRIVVDGQDVSSLRGEQLRQFRRRIQLVYQNPFASLDPRQSIFDIVEEPLLNFDPVPKAERRERVHAILKRVGLPEASLTRLPAALSGGQRQRVAIARAIILNPGILVLDEAVSALDVTVQAQILELLDELQRSLGLTYLFVSHDLAVVRQIADTVSVLRDGKQVERGSIEDVFERPAHDYTRELIAAIPGSKLKSGTGFLARTVQPIEGTAS